MALCAEGKVRVAATRALPVSRLGREVTGTSSSVATGCVALEARCAPGKVAHSASGALPVTVTGLDATAVGVARGPLLLLEATVVAVVPAVGLALVLVPGVVLLLFLATVLLLILVLTLHVARHHHCHQVVRSNQSHPRIEIKSKNHVINTRSTWDRVLVSD